MQIPEKEKSVKYSFLNKQKTSDCFCFRFLYLLTRTNKETGREQKKVELHFIKILFPKEFRYIIFTRYTKI